LQAKPEKVIDNLILSNVQSVWQMHDHEHSEAEENPAHGEEGHVHFDGDEHEHHDHDSHEHEEHDAVSENGKEITAVLIKIQEQNGFCNLAEIGRAEYKNASCFASGGNQPSFFVIWNWFASLAIHGLTELC
jgi:hypothetical protein